MVSEDPANDLIPKLVRGLLARRVQGRWSNTQENAFILMALVRYCSVLEKDTPDFVARAWLGSRQVSQHEFRGRSNEETSVGIPIHYLAGLPPDQKLVLSKEGTGRLYYRLAMDYAPASLALGASNRGFAVVRRYESIDDPADVSRDAAGVWHIKAGARIRVRVSIENAARRYHVALIDPLPAGLEPLNPGIAGTGSIPRDPKETATGWRWNPNWFEHQNFRDDRVEVFTSLLVEGVHTYTYVARATTPGVFLAAPPKAEEMYSPETFGRAASDRVIVR